jgi:hypothetical protein
MQKDGNEIVETAVEARGGLIGRPVLLVLIVSCLLAVFALIVPIRAREILNASHQGDFLWKRSLL